MSFNITKGSDLLTRKQYENLDPKELKDYNNSAAKFAVDFNTAFPEGKVVKVKIEQVRCTDNGIVIAVAAHPDLSTRSIRLPYEIGDILGENCGVKSAEGLASLVLSSLTPIFLTQTVKAVTTADTYVKGGTPTNYTAPTMTKVEGTYEAVELSNDAKALVAELHLDGLRSIISGGTNRRPNVQAAVVRRATAEVEDAEV